MFANNRNLDFTVVTANVKIPVFDGRYQPYLLAGVGYFRQHTLERGTAALRAGFGLDIFIIPSLSMGIEMAYLTQFPELDLDAAESTRFNGASSLKFNNLSFSLHATYHIPIR